MPASRPFVPPARSWRMAAPADWRARAVSAAAAVGVMRSGMRVFVHGAAATPTPLLEALVARTDVEGVRLVHLHTGGPAPWVTPALAGRFRSVSLFTGAAVRDAIAEGRADYVPVFLSDIPALFRSRAMPLDVALVQVSPPDRHGLCSLGTSVDVARAAVDSATFVVAEVNARMPRTHGAGAIPLDRFDAVVCTDRALPAQAPEPPDAVAARIGALVAALVPDRATLQMGIGTIPNAVLAQLHDRRDLGVHTECFSDSLVALVAAGAVSNRYKAVHPGRVVTSFVDGSPALYDFVDDNPLVEFHPSDRVNDTDVISRNPRVVAINSALQVDLSGQVCADSLGHRVFSGIGGQMDFIRGAARSRGGVPVIALPATAAGGRASRIVAELAPGAGVVTTRGHVHWVVTEYGAVNLHGATLRERGERLASIAHPDVRGELLRDLQRLRLAD